MDNVNNADKEFLTISEAAKFLNVSVSTLRNWDKNNTFKPAYVTTGGTRYYSQEQLNNFLGLKIKTKINKKNCWLLQS